IFGGHNLTSDLVGRAADALSTGQGRFTPFTPGSDRAGPHGSLPLDVADLVLRQGLLNSLTSTGRSVVGSLGGLFDRSRGWGQSFGENLGISGVGGLTRDLNPAVRAGRTAGTNVEDFFRGAQWLREVRNGATPEMAAREINKLHFDYD